MSSLAGKVAVVFGATGNVGSGAVDAFLQAGATVVGVGRDLKKLEELKAKLGNNEHFLLVQGEYVDEATVAKLHENIKKALAGKDIDHIVSSVGFVYAPPGAVTQSSLKDFHHALNEGLPQNFLIAREFLPGLKQRDGSSFAIVSGGFAYACPEPGYWTGTLKNAALNALTLGLASETKNDKVRVNNLCIHISVTAIDGEKNQFGWPGTDPRQIGKIFVALAQGSTKGVIVQLEKPDAITGLIATHSK